MTIYMTFRPLPNSFSPSKIMKKPIYNDTTFSCYMNKQSIDKIMQQILIEFCNSSVIGYDKFEDKFWCKKFYKSRCDFHIELKIIRKDKNTSYISIKSIMGNIHLIDLFIGDLKESLELYRTSTFIKSCIEKTY